MLVLLRRTSFLTTIYGLYFSLSLHKLTRPPKPGGRDQVPPPWASTSQLWLNKFVHRSAKLAPFLLLYLVNIKHIIVPCWPNLCWGQFNKTTYYGTEYLFAIAEPARGPWMVSKICKARWHRFQVLSGNDGRSETRRSLWLPEGSHTFEFGRISLLQGSFKLAWKIEQVNTCWVYSPKTK